MPLTSDFWLSLLLSFFVAAVVAFVASPFVRRFACAVGAMDIPSDERRMHNKPIPRLGGLSIFLGFVISVLLFSTVTKPVMGILLGAVVIVALGVVDDIISLPAWFKLFVQIGAALIPALNDVQIARFHNPFSPEEFVDMGVFSIPITVLWIVIITNSVNLIDGLDGLAAGVSAISGFSLLTISVILQVPQVPALMAAMTGACLGFLPFNRNPAKMFMGDTGATFLGFVLATVSIQGLFKLYAVISFAIPFLILGLPLFDTIFAISRRLANGKSPMVADRSHVHHKLVDLGFTQKQAVAILYILSVMLGLVAVVLISSGESRIIILLTALLVGFAVAICVPLLSRNGKDGVEDEKTGNELSADAVLIAQQIPKDIPPVQDISQSETVETGDTIVPPENTAPEPGSAT